MTPHWVLANATRRQQRLMQRRALRRAMLRIFMMMAALTIFALQLYAQDATVRDLTTVEGAGPVRLVGYGLVTGLPGTGDRVTGSVGSRQTVQSVVNLLRNFEVQVPANLLRTRNVAAVLVTAEVSPFLRPGGRFDVQVSSIGDAPSLRGGVLWMTPLVSEVGGTSMAVAQGTLVISDGGSLRPASRTAAVAAGRVPDGGVVEVALPRPEASREARLLLREPDPILAVRIATAIDSVVGREGTATVEDPGAILLKPQGGADKLPGLLAQIGEIRIRRSTPTRILVDARDGTVVAGSELVVADGMVSSDGITIVIGGKTSSGDTNALPSGATVREIAEALRGARASAQQTANIFMALRDAGAIRAEVVVR